MDADTAWECLKEGSLAFNPPKRFNDPFDTNPALDFNFSEQKIKRLRHDRRSKGPLNIPNIKAAMLKNRKSFIENVIGVACFTSKKDDPLMWAHYGDKHKGVMLAFDATHSDLSGLQKVAYSPTRPSVDAIASNVGEAMLVKGSAWKHEREWRLTAQLSKCEVKMIGGTPIYIQRLNRQCFDSITFGCRSDDAFVRAVVNGLKQWNLEHCCLRRLRLCDKTYSFAADERMLEGIWQLNE